MTDCPSRIEARAGLGADDVAALADLIVTHTIGLSEAKVAPLHRCYDALRTLLDTPTQGEGDPYQPHREDDAKLLRALGFAIGNAGDETPLGEVLKNAYADRGEVVQALTAPAPKPQPAPTVGREEVVEALIQLSVKLDSNTTVVNLDRAIDAIEALFSPTERADPGAGEPVVWRWRLAADVEHPSTSWAYGDKPSVVGRPDWDVQPLYTTPSPASTSSGGDEPDIHASTIIAFDPADPETGNAVIFPEEPGDRPYFTLIGLGPDGWQNRVAKLICDRFNAAPALTSSSARPVGEDYGWVYFNPDSGEEYDTDHPVLGGMVPDATEVRPATAQEKHLWSLWQVSDQSNRRMREGLEKIAKMKAEPITGTEFQQGPAILWRAARDIARAALKDNGHG